MKLRSKVTLIAIMASAVALIVFSILLFYTVSLTKIEAENISARTRSQLVTHEFEADISSQWDQGLSQTVKDSLVPHIFRTSSEKSPPGVYYILYKGNKALYNTTGYTPDLLMSAGKLQIDNDIKYTTVRAGGEYLLITNHPVLIRNKPTDYSVYIISDVTWMYNGLNKLILQFSFAGICVLIVCALVVYILINQTLAPLSRLRKQAVLVADGVYGKLLDSTRRDELGDLTNSFNRMSLSVEKNIEKLTEMAEQRRLLLAAMTHEIKTPMTSIVGYSEALMRVKLTEEERQKSIERINMESKRLERLSQKLMGLITLEEDAKLEVADVSYQTLLEEVRETTEERFNQRGILLTFDADATEQPMDLDLMVSMLRNLLDNAANAGATKIRIVAKNNMIEIQDNGRGIPKEELERIMQPFYRVDKSRSKKSGGSGLGLSICQKIAFAHSAMLTFESTVGKGTTVRILFTH